MREVISIHHEIIQKNLQDLQNRYDSSSCENNECVKHRSRYKTHKSFRRRKRMILTLGLFIRYKIFDNTKMNVWCTQLG